MYFKVIMQSANMCGFDSVGVFVADNESDLLKLDGYVSFLDEMQDYVNGWVDEEDYEENDDANELMISVDEITEVEYLEFMEYVGAGADYYYHVG